MQTPILHRAGARQSQIPAFWDKLYLRGEKRSVPHDILFFAQNGMGGVRQGQWKLVMPVNAEPQLFDLSCDIEEQHNLADAHPAKVKELVAKWHAWHAPMPPPPNAGGKKRAQQPALGAEPSRNK